MSKEICLIAGDVDADLLLLAAKIFVLMPACVNVVAIHQGGIAFGDSLEAERIQAHRQQTPSDFNSFSGLRYLTRR